MHNKRNYIILICISLILLAIFINTDFNTKKNSEIFSNLCISKEEFNNIQKERNVTNSSILNSLFFNGEKLIFDNKNNTFYYSLVEGDKDAYNPTIEWTNNSISLSISNSVITNDLIKNNESLNIIAYDRNKYHVYEIKCTTLPILNINCGDVDNKQDFFTREYDYRKAKIELFDNRKDTNVRLNTYDGKIKVRGNDSKKYPKKGYKLIIDQYEVEDNKKDYSSLLGLREGNEYVLYAAYNDQEKIRNVFSSNLWYDSCSKNNEFGVNNGAQYKYVELFRENEYWGLYALGFKVDDLQENINLDEDSKEYIYKKLHGGIPELNYDFTNFEKNEYSMESNKNDKYSKSVLDNYYRILLNSNNKEELLEIADIDNSIDIYLFFNLVQHVDGACSIKGDIQWLYNIFLISKEKNNNVKMIFAPWDMDRTWGEGFDNEITYDIPNSFNVIIEYNTAYKLLQLNDKEINEMVIERYKHLRENEWSDESLLKMLNLYEGQIFDSGAYIRDQDRWPNAMYSDNDLAKFKEYVLNRVHYCDSFYLE